MSAPPTEPSRRRRAVLAVLSVLLLGGIVEYAASVVENALAARGVVYTPAPPGNFAGYLERRDPLLGWPFRAPRADLDASGSRIVPAFPDPAAPACVSLYGDSFAYGAEVEHQAAWGNLLSRRLGCRVSNFGVAGYGTDQAYLRFEANTADRAPTVLLCHMSENIARNVNQFRALLYPGRQFVLKPRFVLEADGSLRLVPLPTLSPAEFAGMLRDPAAYLEHEDLLPGTRLGPVWGRFPHTLTVLAALANRRVLAHLEGSAFWNELYEPDHPTRALGLTAAILAAFDARARAQERAGAVVVFPTHGDLIARRRGEAWTYQSLLDDLRRRDIRSLNVGDGLLDELRGSDPAAIFSPTGNHYNAAGNRLVADIVGRFLAEGAAPPAPEGGGGR